MSMEYARLVIVRGGGDIATGTIQKLHRAGYPVLVLETAQPTAIRRQVALSEAIYDGMAKVEDITAVLVCNWDDAKLLIALGQVPILIDPHCSVLEQVKPLALIDAILAKRNLGTNRQKAGIIVALGPGFSDDAPVLATLDGIIRGLIRDGFTVAKGLKIADIDPRESELHNCFTISEKSRCIGGSVLEAVMMLEHCQNGR